jgi:hypothetical protein
MFLPRDMCRLLEVPIGRFVTATYFYPAILCVPMAFPLHRDAAVLVCASLSTAHYQSACRLGSLRAGSALVVLTREPVGVQFRGSVVRYLSTIKAR